MNEQIDHLEQEFGRQFNNAPRELKATINMAIRAIQLKNCGEALNELRRAQKIVDDQRLESWRAELHVAWVLYYSRNCPELEDNAMWHHIAQAQRLEPGNEGLSELIQKIKNERQP